jgi:hypothetical protein
MPGRSAVPARGVSVKSAKSYKTLLIALFVAPLLFLFLRALPTDLESVRPGTHPLVFPVVWLFQALKLFFRPVFTILRFLEDYVTFVFNKVNGLLLYVTDKGFSDAKERIECSWKGLCNGTKPCRCKDAERLQKVQERVEKLTKQGDEQ